MHERQETSEQREARLRAFEKDLLPVKNKWQLNNVDDIEYTIDVCGIYVLINWQCQTNTVRLDIMSDNHEPRQSFAGTSDNVRKHAMRWIRWNGYQMTLEHAAYIGAELEKADRMRGDYIQDRTKLDLSDLYLHTCPATNRIFLCQKKVDNNIAEIFDVKRWYHKGLPR